MAQIRSSLRDSQNDRRSASWAYVGADITVFGIADGRGYTHAQAVLGGDFAGDLPPAQIAPLLDRWNAWAQRSRLPAFVKLGRTIRAHRDGILAAIRLGLSNSRVEGRNATIRLITRRGFGFHTAKAPQRS